MSGVIGNGEDGALVGAGPALAAAGRPESWPPLEGASWPPAQRTGDPEMPVLPPDLTDCTPGDLLEVLRGNLDVAMAVVDSCSRLVRCNGSASRFFQRFGIQRGDSLAGMAVETFAADGVTVVPQQQRPLARALHFGESTDHETLVLRYGEVDTPHRIVMSAHPIMLRDGTRGAVNIWHDISEGGLSAERNTAELGRLSELLEGAPDYAIFRLDPEGRVVTWSTSAERLFGRTEEQVLGSSFAVLFTDEARRSGEPEWILAAARDTGRAESSGLRVRADGSTFWAHGVVTASREPNGSLRGFVKVTHDVTEQRVAEQSIADLNAELQALNESLERRVLERTDELERQKADLAAVVAELEAFSYSVSHDLRAPLRAMSGFARIIEQEYADQLPPEAARYLQRVHENATQMGSLIDALLAFSRMQRLSMSPEPLDMAALAMGSWTALAPARQDREIDFVMGDLPRANGDRRLLQQVWSNVLDNAIKYTGQRDRALIEVSAAAADGMVTYRIRDNGVGFDMRYVDKIGQVFQRLHRTDDFHGVGIGLALVQRIVQRHGGSFDAHGEPGRGATFSFSLREAS